MRRIRNQFMEPDPPTSEVSGGKLMLEVAGYIPKHVQLNMLQSSGEALMEYRKKLFPEFEQPDAKTSYPEFDPTVQKGYDFFDYHEDTVIVQNNLRLSELEAQRRAEQEELLKAKERAKAETNHSSEPPNTADAIPES